MVHDENENIWGIKGLDLGDTGLGILRNTGGAVAAGVQGGAGGPFFFTKRYGVLVDSDGGAFQAQDETIRFQRGSRPDAEYFVIVGPPLKSMAGLALLTGRPPMPPKWTLGFLNSQWVSTEEEWRQMAETYAKKDIPVSGFIFDFDWKAWGEDDYGEWRWNSTSGEGKLGPEQVSGWRLRKICRRHAGQRHSPFRHSEAANSDESRGWPAHQGSRIRHRTQSLVSQRGPRE